MGKLVVWVCGACGHISNSKENAYARGCGTWSVECYEDNVERHPTEHDRAVKATALAAIQKLEIKVKVTL